MSCEWIAEISSNHNGSLERCLAIIDAAKACGCTGIKLQLFRVDKMYTSSTLAKHPRLNAQRQYEVPLAWVPAVRGKCDALGLKLGITPFYLDAVANVSPYVDFFKIASYEAAWLPLVAACAATGKRLVISVGMLSYEEIEEVCSLIQDRDNLTLLHCNSEYPANPAKANLRRILTLWHWASKSGYSDHTCNPRIIEHAVLFYDAQMVELHLDLEDGQGAEAGHSWRHSGLKPTIELCKMDEPWDSWDTPERDWMRQRDGYRLREDLR